MEGPEVPTLEGAHTPSSDLSAPGWMTKEEAARHLSVSPKQVQRWITGGDLPASRRGRIVRLWTPNVDKWMKQQSAAGATEPVTAVVAEPERLGAGEPDAAGADDVALGRQARAAGIRTIFTSRVFDPNYVLTLNHALERARPPAEIWIMANSARSLFSKHADPLLYYPLWQALENKVRIRLLLLDPTSEAAHYRARIEEPETFEQGGYRDTHLYKDSLTVARTLEKPDPDWMRMDSLRERMVDRRQVQVRYSDSEPTTMLIITGDVIFCEQYHTGGGPQIEDTLRKRGFPRLYCFGGFVNVLVYERASLTGALLASHFENSWERGKELSLAEIEACAT